MHCEYLHNVIYCSCCNRLGGLPRGHFLSTWNYVSKVKTASGHSFMDSYCVYLVNSRLLSHFSTFMIYFFLYIIHDRNNMLFFIFFQVSKSRVMFCSEHTWWIETHLIFKLISTTCHFTYISPPIPTHCLCYFGKQVI